MDPIEEITDDLYKGPFHAKQVALRATFYEDLGNLWTRAFGDPVEEYWAVRRNAGLWDVSALVKWRFTGRDALVALDRLTTRRVADAAPGRIRYGMMLDRAGKMLDEGTVCVVSAEDVFFMGNDDRPPFEEHVKECTADLDVEIENMTQVMSNISVQGPDSFELLTRLTDLDLTSLAYFRLLPRTVELAGVPGLLTRTGFSGDLGYEFFLESHEGAETLWDAIASAGARPIGLDAVEILRVEAGLLIQEEDYFVGETDPYDLSMDAFIDLEDHDFVGRDACVAMAASPPRRFVTLEIEGDEALERGAIVVRGGSEIGRVTSSAVSPRLGALALSILDSGSASEGTEVLVEGRAALVRPVPVDPGARLRPRSDPRAPLRAE